MKKLFMRILRKEEGAAAVEFALVSPFIIFLIVGMMDFAFYINQRMALESLARAAAEYVVKGGDIDLVDEDVLQRSRLTQENEDEEPLEVSGEVACECGGGEAVTCGEACPNGYQRRFYSISLSKTYSTMFKYPGLPQTMVLTGNTRLQIE
jgi:Flp pilus assembly pilin Flp